MDDVPKAYTQYAAKLNSHLRLAWKTALEVTQAAQEENALNTALKSDTTTVVKVGDRVCRRIPNHTNKLQFFYSGPYRVQRVLSNSRYKLRDLENRLVKDEVHISNLRPYHTITDEDAVEEDEYLVEELLQRRGSGAKTEYLVKWRGIAGSPNWEGAAKFSPITVTDVHAERRAMGDPALYPEVRTARLLYLYAMQWLPPDLRADYQARQQWIDNNLTYDLDGLALAEFHSNDNDADFRRGTWSVYHDLHMCRLGVCPQWLWSLDVYGLSTPTAIIHIVAPCASTPGFPILRSSPPVPLQWLQRSSKCVTPRWSVRVRSFPFTVPSTAGRTHSLPLPINPL